MSDVRVLVVGTTADYIAYLWRTSPSRVLFLTDEAVRFGATDDPPPHPYEVLIELSDESQTLERLRRHLQRHDIELSGTVAYDCEQLSLASRIARVYNLPHTDPAAIERSRNKYETKRVWQAAGIDCPRHLLVSSAMQAKAAVESLNGPVVMKPLTGAGSELTFFCPDGFAASQAYQIFRLGLKQRAHVPLYAQAPAGTDPSTTCIVEEHIEGREYSADFFVDGDTIVLVRIARKLVDPSLAFGVTMAYVVPGRLPGWFSTDVLSRTLQMAAHALGIDRALCMVDFMVTHERVCFLEMTPRVGGDCLPPLVRHTSGIDTLQLALDVAEGGTPSVKSLDQFQRLVGLRLFARKGGIIRRLSAQSIQSDARVREVYLKRTTGHRVLLPPDDYDSWQLGHVIFCPDGLTDLEEQCRDLTSRLICEIEPLIRPEDNGYGIAGGHGTVPHNG